MHLVLAPTVGDGKSIETAWRPLVPEQLARAWREASSDWAGSGQTLVYLTEGTDEDLAACEKLGGEIVKAATTQDMAETVALFEAVKAEGAPPLFEERPALDDVVAKIMQDVVPVVNSKREAEGKAQLLDVVQRVAKDAGGGAIADLAGKIVALILLGVPLHVLLRLFAGHPGIYALTTLHQDNFNRSNGALHGMTMSDGLGAWAHLLGTDVNVIGTSEIQQNGGGGTQVYWDSAMSDVDEQRVVAKMTGERCGPAARVQSNGDCYFGYWRPALNDNRLYRYESGYNFLGSGIADVHLNDTCGVYAHGTTIINEANGVTDITVTGQTTFPTGRGGFYMDTPTTSKMDDWRVETAASGVTVSGIVASLGFEGVAGTATAAAASASAVVAAAALTAVVGTAVAAAASASGIVASCAFTAIAGTATAAATSAAGAIAAVAFTAVVGTVDLGSSGLVSGVVATVGFAAIAGTATAAAASSSGVVASCGLQAIAGTATAAAASATGKTADVGLAAVSGTATAAAAGASGLIAGATFAAVAGTATTPATTVAGLVAAVQLLAVAGEVSIVAPEVEPRSVGVRRAGGFRVVRAGGYRVRTP